eukprot:COSAG02_NODE_46698_length_347_cov_0.383065_1_plen_57_part_01
MVSWSASCWVFGWVGVWRECFWKRKRKRIVNVGGINRCKKSGGGGGGGGGGGEDLGI